MRQDRTLIIALVTLFIGFVAGFVLRPVIVPVAQAPVAAAPSALAEARGMQYFAAHLDEARRIVAQCRDGSVRGDECANADAAVIAAEGREQTERFLGKRP
ncbi:hypothetical protein LZK98_17445 [Sphingomonas cannabina]|uniref:hypothetical protein n=1 Tax=Sphingomonas cannabina TaxID=2899123 RepID=UPI001F426F5E|nr:hypothetical protein [Sphingomonas cannabina]UIJ44820.1 hypothetical protein LZK98_17445 [Sphingomonas cannabina]